MKLTKLFNEFFESEQASGIVLILCAISAIAIANSSFGHTVLEFWHLKVGFEAGGIFLKQSIEHWINDGLMAIFFLLIGLEIERELYIGELSDRKSASLPIFAAVGGMAVPALVYFLINLGSDSVRGIGIPMATDIAFALGVLSLLGSRVPAPLKVFLAALAIVDDLGAIIMIALFYTNDFSLVNFALAAVIFVLLLVLNRMGVKKLAYYLIPGAFMWYFMLQSGVHATVAGVLLAFAIPFGSGKEDSPSYKLQHVLHKPVAFFIMPIFAFVNTGIVLSGTWMDNLGSSNALGIIGGLFIGKPLGILLASALGVSLGLAQLPKVLKWGHIIGAGFLGGIGFTMSIFITLLAFGDPAVVQNSKIAILFASFFAGSIGFLILRKQEAPLQPETVRSS